jgi:hypothetical protein
MNERPEPAYKRSRLIIKFTTKAFFVFVLVVLMLGSGFPIDQLANKIDQDLPQYHHLVDKFTPEDAKAATAGKSVLYFHKEASDYNTTYAALALTPPEPAAYTRSTSTGGTVATNATPPTALCAYSLPDTNNQVVVRGNAVANRCAGSWISSPVGQSFSMATSDASAISSIVNVSVSTTAITTIPTVYVYKLCGQIDNTGNHGCAAAGNLVRLATLAGTDPTTASTTTPQVESIAAAAPAVNSDFNASDRIAAIMSFNTSAGTATTATNEFYLDNSAQGASPTSVTLKYTYSSPNRPGGFSGTNDDDFTVAATTASGCAASNATTYNTKWTCITPTAANSQANFNAEDTSAAGAGDSSSWLWLQDKYTGVVTPSNFGTTPSNAFLSQSPPSGYGDGTVTTVLNSTSVFKVGANSSTTPYSHSGLVLWTSNTDYLEMQVYATGDKGSTLNVADVALSTNGTLSGVTSINPATTTGVFNRIWLRFVVTNGSYQGQYSTDGTSFTNIGSPVAHANFGKFGLNTYNAIGAAAGAYAGAFEYFSSTVVAAGTVTIGTTGTQTTTVQQGNTNKFLGGAFTLTESAGRPNITSIGVTLSGTGLVAGDLANMKLYYDNVASCTTADPVTDATQYGSTTASPAVAKNTFTATVALNNGSPMCVYVVIDIAGGATVGHTIEISIAANTDVAVSAGSTSGTAAIAGTTTIAAGFVISGTSNCGCASTVKVAINGVLDGTHSGTVSSGNWSISGTSVSTGQVVVVWLDNVADSAESTAVAKYDGTGDMTGIILNTNVLSIGSVDDQSLTLTNLDTYDCASDEDVMYLVSSSVLQVEGLASCAGTVSNIYNNETLQIESGDTLTVGGTETVSTRDIVVNGTLSGTGNVTAYGGDVTGNGTITMTGGTFTVGGTGSFGGNTGWTFNDLKQGSGNVLTDNFNRADQNPLAGNWTTSNGAIALKILSNQLTFASDFDASANYSATTFSNDQYSQVKLSNASGSGATGFGVTVRQSTSANTRYRVTADSAASNNIQLGKEVNNVYSNLTGWPRTATVANGDTLRLEVQGTTLRVYINGVQVGADTTDSSIASGYPGIIYSSSAPSATADDWAGGDYIGTITATGSGAINVNGAMTVSTSATLNAGSKTWNLAGKLAVDSEMPTQVGQVSTAGANTLSYSFTNTSGTLLVCTLVVGNNAVPVVSAFTYGGVALTAKNSIGWDGSNISKAFIYYLLNPLTGANTVGITLSSTASSSQRITSGCISFTGNSTSVDPFAQTGTNVFDAATTTASLALNNTTAGNIIVDVIGTGSGVSSTTQTLSWLKNTDIINGGNNGASSRAVGTGGTVTMGYTVVSDRYGMVAAEVAAANPLTVNGTFTAGSSTVNFNGNANVNIPALTGANSYNNLTLSPSISPGKTYTFGSGTTTVGGNLDVNPTASAPTLGLGTRLNNGSTITSPATITATVTESSPLLVAIVWAGAQTITGVTWNGSENLTLISTQTSGNNVAVYGLKNPTVTSANVSVTFSANPNSGAEVFVIPTTGGDTVAGWRTVYTRTNSNGTGPGLTVTDSQNGDVVFHAAVVSANSITWDAGETTTNTTANLIAGSGFSGGMSTKPAVGASTVVGNTDVATYAEIAFALIPSSNYRLTVKLGGTLSVTGSVTIEKTSSAVATLDTTTSNYALNAGSIILSSGGTLVGNASTITDGGNWTNNGTFTQGTSTVVFNGSGISTLAGATTFHHVTDTTAGSTLKFTHGQIFTWDSGGVFTVSSAGANVTITSDTTAVWLAHFTTAQSAITNVTIQHSGCDSGTASVTLDGTATNDGTATVNDTTCWIFPSANILIQGNVYTDDATTALGTCGSTASIAARFNGVTYTGSCTAGTGAFSLTGPLSAPGAGTPLIVWIDGAVCGGNNSTGTCGTTVIRYAGSSNVSSIKLRVNRLVLRSDSGSITDTDLATYKNSDDSDIVYAAVAATSLNVEDQVKLVVDVGTFAPAGTVTTDTASSSGITDGDLTITSGATLSMGTNALSIGGDFVNSGTFSKSSGQTTTFTATGTGFTITPGTGNFDAVTLNGSGGGWSMGAAGTIDGNLTITAGTLTLGAFALTTTGTTSVTGSLICPAAATCAGLKTFTGALTVASGGTFDLTTSSTAATSLFSAGITQSSNVANSFKAGSGAAQLVGNLAGAGTGGINFAGGLTINSGTTSNGYTGGTTTVTGTLTLTGNWAQANGSTLSLGSTTPFSGAGTFSASTATNTVNYSASGAQTAKDPDGGTAHTYNNLTLSGSGAKTLTGITAVTGNLALSGTATATTGANLVVTGTLTVGDGTTLTLGAFTFETDGTATIGGGASGIFTATSGTAITLKGNLSIASGATWTKMTSGTVTFSKGAAQTITDSTSGQDLGVVALTTASTSVSTNSNIKLTSLNIGGSTTFDATGDTILFTGSGTAGSRPLVNSGTLTTTSSTFDFEGTAATDVETTSVTYNNLSVGVSAGRAGGVTFTLNGSTTVSGLLTVGNSGSTSADTLALGATTLTLSGSSSTPLTLAGSSKGLISAGTSTVQYTGTSAILAATTFNNLTLGTGSTASSTIPAGGITINGNLAIGNNSTVTKGGTVTFSKGGTQTWTDSNATANDLGAVVTATASTNLQLGSSVKATSLNFVSTTTFTPGANTLELTGSSTPFTVGGTFTATSSTIKYSGATPTVTNTTYNNLTLACGTSCTMPASNLTLNGNLLVNGTAITKAAGVIIFMKPGGGTQTLTDTTGSDLGSIQLTASGGVTTLSLSSSVKLTGITVDSSQVFTTGANTITFTGTTPVTGSFTPSTSSTIAYVPSQASGTVTLPANFTYYNLTLNKASNTFRPASGTLATTNNLNVTAGTLDLATNNNTTTIGGTTTIDGTLTAPAGNLTIKGDFTNNGTFTHSSGTVVVDFSFIANQGSITIGGTATPQAFNNITANASTSAPGKILKFKSGSTFTFAGTVTLSGNGSAPLKIASSTPTSQWTATLNGTSSVAFLAVVDSGCSGGNSFTTANNSDSIFNLGNNGICWVFISRGSGGVVGGGGNGGGSGGGSANNGCASNCSAGGGAGSTGSGGGNPTTGGTLAVDASSPVRFTGTPADNVNITSASFTPPSNSLLLALVSADAAASTNITILVSDSTGLTWTQAAIMDPGHSGGNGHASVWYAVQPTTQAMTVSAKRTSSGGSSNQISVKVYVITGFTLSSPIGVTGTGTSTTNNITPTIYTSATDNSLGFVSATEYNHLGLPASTDVYDAASYANIASLGGRKASVTTPAATQVTFNLDAFGASSASWNWVAVEVKSVASQGGGGGGGGGSP